jgi:hypothetical protein
MNQTLKQAFDQASQLSSETQNAIAQIIFNEIKNNQEDSKNHKLQESQEVSAYDELQEFLGCVDGGDGDLATNKKYLEGFGK